jgi:hypothetical protein
LKIPADKILAERSESNSYVFAWPISLQQRTKTVFSCAAQRAKKRASKPVHSHFFHFWERPKQKRAKPQAGTFLQNHKEGTQTLRQNTQSNVGTQLRN